MKFSKDKRYKYVYLLLDPDLVKTIMEKQEIGVNEDELFELFIQAIIYVGKGFGIWAFEHDQIWIDRSDQIHEDVLFRRRLQSCHSVPYLKMSRQFSFFFKLN